jgi:ribose 1,5-bisphosphate isomerase
VPELPPLPAQARTIAEQIVGHQLLGASRTVRLINDVLVAVAYSAEGSGAEVAEQVRAVSAFFVAVRGSTTPVVNNAATWMLSGLDEATLRGADHVRAHVDARRRAFNERSAANVAAIAAIGAACLAGVQTVFVYDYSSSVMAVLRQVAEAGRCLRLLVPESRTVDGGRPIVREALAWGHSAEFFVDAAFAAFVPRAQAALVGAETLLADGSFLTTPGTYPLAVLCDLHHVPFYVPTELLKLERNSFSGSPTEIVSHDQPALLDADGSLQALGQVHFPMPALERTPARYISAYLTELGPMPPGAVWAAGRRALGLDALDRYRGIQA